MSKLIFAILIALPILGYLLEQYLNHLNNTMWSDKLPEQLRGICPEEDYKKSQLYHRDKQKLSFWSSTLNIVVILAMLIFGGFALVDTWAKEIVGDNPIWIAVVFFMIIGAASIIIDIPFDYYDTFVIEKRYGFNTMTVKMFIIDQLKSLLLSAIIGLPLFYLITWLYYKIGQPFWLYAWGVLTLFSLFFSFFYSELIVPIFNKQTPLEEGSLRTKIEDFANRVGFALDNIFVIDGSKRSTKSNAYFTGFGSKKRIVLYDTLMNDFSDDEIVAILGHEIGHYKKRHIIWSMITSILINGLTLFIFSRVVDSQAIADAMGVVKASFHIGIIAFAILYSPLSLVIDLISNYISRKNEYAADKFSAENYNPHFLADALKKLSIKNLSNMLPHPAYIFFHYSHPSLLQRLSRLE